LLTLSLFLFVSFFFVLNRSDDEDLPDLETAPTDAAPAEAEAADK